MTDIVLGLILGMAIWVCWPQEPVLLVPGSWQPRRWKFSVEDQNTIEFLAGLNDLKPPPEPEWLPQTPPLATAGPKGPSRPSHGRHRADANIGGRPVFGAPRKRTAPLGSYTEEDALDSTRMNLLRIKLDELERLERTRTDLPGWARDPEGQP
jgi:hypothetical protein